jgi:DNA-binding MarR family transcriptional regulator
MGPNDTLMHMKTSSAPLPSAPSDDAGAVALGPLRTKLHHALRAAQAGVMDELHAALAAEEMRALPFAIMVVLSRNPGLRQIQVGFALGIQPTNLVPLIDALEERGLAERRPVPRDRRAHGLFLTRLGAETLARLEAQAAAHEARLAERLGPGGREQLLALLRRLTDPRLPPAQD